MVRGGIYAVLFTLAFTFPTFIVYFRIFQFKNRTNLVLSYLLVSVIMISLGAIHGGLTAIYVRDHGQTQRIRLIPQFTLQELLIIFFF